MRPVRLTLRQARAWREVRRYSEGYASITVTELRHAVARAYMSNVSSETVKCAISTMEKLSYINVKDELCFIIKQ
jgi:hypothetical protein